MIETLGAPPPPRRRRRRSREAERGAAPAPLPLTRATAVRAFAPFGAEEEASGWLEEASAAEDSIDAAGRQKGSSCVNRALHAHAVASGDPTCAELTACERGRRADRLRQRRSRSPRATSPPRARSTSHGGGASRRQQRAEELRPQERVAAVLGGRERLDACETLLLRARADLDAGREREAALQLRVGLEALLVELHGALADPGHEEDMAALETPPPARSARPRTPPSRGDLDAEQSAARRRLLAICERVLRRRRVLRG